MRFLVGKFRASTSLLGCLAAAGLLSTSAFAETTQNGYQQSTWLLAQTDEQGNQPITQETPQAAVVPIVPAEPASPTVQIQSAPEPFVTQLQPIKHKPYYKKKNKHTIRPHVVKPVKHSAYPYRNTKTRSANSYFAVTSQQPTAVYHKQPLPQPTTTAPIVTPIAVTPALTTRQTMGQKSVRHDTDNVSNTNRPWSFIIGAGYTDYADMYSDDGQTGVARLAVARNVYTVNDWAFGVEVGMQNGNTMRLESTQAALDLLDGIPIETTVKPVFDLLASVKKTIASSPFFLVGKAGIAYRRWQFNNLNQQTIDDLSEVNAEIQAGVGYAINSKIHLSFLYQGIYGGNPSLTVNTTAGTGSVSNIPMQNGALFSLSVIV
ncbi:MAG: hypothetical protein Q8L78_03115 [Coxiellaceae bacterium]|nr:hypothetical protein [Coxiellaceae bacterium]